MCTCVSDSNTRKIQALLPSQLNSHMILCIPVCTLLTCTHTCTHVYTLTIAPSGSPKWLTVGCNLPTSVQLSWGAVPEDQQNGEITGYSIQVEGPGTTRSIQIATTVSDWTRILYRPLSLMEDEYTSEKVCDLKPSTEYTFNVSATTKAGSGPAISVSFVTPQEGKA